MITFQNPATFSARITSVLGDARPYGGHEGIDLAPTDGRTAIVAAASGTVADVGYQPDGYGNFVRITHADGYSTIYGHLRDTPLVTKGEKVTAGQEIGIVGSTGYSTGTHLHFSIVRGGEYLNPMDYINAAVPSVVGKAIEAVQSSIKTALQKIDDSPCYWMDGISEEDWIRCLDGIVANMTPAEKAAMEAERLIVPDQPNPYGALKGLNIKEALSKYSPDTSLTNPFGNLAKDLAGEINSAIILPIKRSIIDGITWPIRAMVNTMKLSPEPLQAGEDTVAWLQQPDNQKLYLASQVALILILILLLFAARQFLSDQAKTVVKTAADPKGAALDAALG